MAVRKLLLVNDEIMVKQEILEKMSRLNKRMSRRRESAVSNESGIIGRQLSIQFLGNIASMYNLQEYSYHTTLINPTIERQSEIPPESRNGGCF